jgi:hypothetical protein
VVEVVVVLVLPLEAVAAAAAAAAVEEEVVVVLEALVLGQVRGLVMVLLSELLLALMAQQRNKKK